MLSDEKDKKASKAPFILYSCLAAIFGVLNALTGPVLPDLEQQANLDSAECGAMFIYRQFGSMLGGFLCGFILDAVRNPHHVLAILIFMKACVELAIPYSYSLQLLALDFGILQFCANAISTVSSTCVSWTYGKLMGFQQNVMNGMFGVGASFAPLLASALRFAGLRAVYGYFFIFSVDLLLVLASLTITATLNPQFAHKANTLLKTAADDSQRVEPNQQAPQVLWLEVVQCCTSLVFGGMGEAAMTYWLYKYARSHLQLTEGIAGLLNTCFFVAFTCTRFLCGFLVTYIGPTAILISSAALSLLASLALVLPGIGTLIPCLAMVAIGIGVAGLYPNSVAMLGRRTFISGRAQGFIRVSAALGTMFGASAPGFLSKWSLIGSSAIPVTLIVAMVAEILLLAIWLCKKA